MGSEGLKLKVLDMSTRTWGMPRVLAEGVRLNLQGVKKGGHGPPYPLDRHGGHRGAAATFAGE